MADTTVTGGKRLIKWAMPAGLFATSLLIQNMGLHIATHFYVQWMYRLRKNLESHGSEKTLSGEKLSTELDEGALHDVVAGYFGYTDIPTTVIDAFSILVPMIWFVWTLLKRDLHLWTKCCLCGALLAIGKGILGVVTVVPDSTGWTNCKNRLGDHGVKYFQDDQNLNTKDMLDFVRDILTLEIWGADHKKLRFCGDMIYSGHTYAVALFGLGIYDLVRMSTIRLAKWAKFGIRFLTGSLLLGILAADVICILANRFHYTVDVLLALMVTLLWYTNGAIAVVVNWWAEGSESTKDEEFTVPPCCLPFCWVDGRYQVHRKKDDEDEEAVSYTAIQQQAAPEIVCRKQ